MTYTAGTEIEFYQLRGHEWRRGTYVGPAKGLSSVGNFHVVQPKRGAPVTVSEGYVRTPPASHLLTGHVAVMKREDGGFYLVGPAPTAKAAREQAASYKIISGDPVAVIQLPAIRFSTGDGL